MGNRRKFTAEFKAEVVLELLSGAKSSAELCREHQIAAAVLADCKTIFLARAARLFETPEQHDSQHVGRIAELERLVGRLTLENDLLKQATSILHQRSTTRARSSRCSARIIPCVRSVGYWDTHAAAMTTGRTPAMRHP